MSKVNMFRGNPIVIQLKEVDGVAEIPTEIQILKVGSFYEKRYGNFNVTPEMLLSMVNNFKNKVRGIDLSLDYEHQTDGKSAAWFKEVYTKDDNKTLWAKVEWTPSGEKTLSDKEYRYISADFSNDFMNNETKKSHGPTLNGAALTNRPVIKGMEPVVQLSEVENNNETGGNMNEQEKKIADLEAMCASLKAENEKLKGAKPEEKSGDDMVALQQKLADMEKKCGELEAEKNKAAEEKKMAEQKSKFDVMLSEGKVVEAQRKPFMDGDMKSFTDLAQPLKLSEVGNGGNGDGKKGDKEVETEITELATVKLSEKKARDLGEAITMVLSENKDLAKKYYEKHQPQKQA